MEVVEGHVVERFHGGTRANEGSQKRFNWDGEMAHLVETGVFWPTKYWSGSVSQTAAL